MADEVRVKDLSRVEMTWLKHIDRRRARILPDDVAARLQRLGLIYKTDQGPRIRDAGKDLLQSDSERPH